MSNGNLTTKHLALLIVFFLIACASNPRRLETVSLKSKVLQKRMHFTLLYPPTLKPGLADRETHIVYLLHGYGGNHRSLDKEGLSDRFLGAWAEGRIPKVVLVMPEGERGFYLNWHDRSKLYEDYIANEIIPQAEQHLGIRVTRDRRHIIGVSMGGYGALLLGFRHPELFASAASISGVLFDKEKATELVGKSFLRWTIDIDRMLGDGCDVEFLKRHNPYSLVDRLTERQRPRIFIAAGAGEPEPIRRPSLLFHEYLVDKGIDHQWLLYDGSHNWIDWAPVIEQAIVFSIDE